ncbi:MAG TPA: VOC family protein [Candidatus Udaeobacter sp.]|nr:VOC family protein [Candidatus Udaeobacter sp.]
MLGTELLGTKDAAATIAVRNLKNAKDFYGTKLGLTPADTREASVARFKTGSSSLLIYESPQNAGTNKATAVTWMVDSGEDVEQIVHALKDRGVRFEHYDMPDTKRDGDIHVSGRMKMAWFKDPDGNILCVVSG